ncbi:MAG: transglutaminase-like domain-containing protein [Desulfococcaceae bacterium]|jgi:transglutaminase-like putative cysteine protease|nr:transglutaminase-like domain-containing protein [Desulfococcaceae bacterium]
MNSRNSSPNADAFHAPADTDAALRPTRILNSDHPEILACAREIAGNEIKNPVKTAVKLYYAVRDGIRYDPYCPFYLPEHYRADNVLRSGRGFCISKAGLLCALGRACGIPSRLGFADVRNHLSTRQLLDYLGSDLFVFHGYTEFFLQGGWVKATPAFNKELCLRHRVSPLDFDGKKDSVFQPYNSEHKPYMEYVKYRGEYNDIPVDEIVNAWKKAYGTERVQSWIAHMEKKRNTSPRSFDAEDVFSG